MGVSVETVSQRIYSQTYELGNTYSYVWTVRLKLCTQMECPFVFAFNISDLGNIRRKQSNSDAWSELEGLGWKRKFRVSLYDCAKR